MKPLELLTHRVTFRIGIIVLGAMAYLALSSRSSGRLGLAVLAATALGCLPPSSVPPSNHCGTRSDPDLLSRRPLLSWGGRRCFHIKGRSLHRRYWHQGYPGESHDDQGVPQRLSRERQAVPGGAPFAKNHEPRRME
jgi:hypothetical protein